MLSKSEQLFLLFCQFVGIRYFKKYWPVKGSYWNDHHIDSTNHHDLKRVIREANEYTRVHVRMLFMESFIMFGGCLTGYVKPEQALGYIPLGFIIHGYALMVHHYNRLIAGVKLSSSNSLKNSKNTKKEILYVGKLAKYEFGEEIEEEADLYYLSFCYMKISPLLSKENVEKFKEYVLDRFKADNEMEIKMNLSKYIFIHNCNTIYQEYVSLQS